MYSEIYEWLKPSLSVWLNNVTPSNSVVSLLCFACGELRNITETALLYFLCHRTIIDIPLFGEVQIDIEYLCDCECTSAAQKKSSQCTKRGTLECAICKCNEGFFGSSCHCDQLSSVNPNNTTPTMQSCLSDINDNTTICSNQGSCVCGQCVCNKQKVGVNVFS